MKKLLLSLAMIVSAIPAPATDEAPDVDAYTVLVCVPSQDPRRRLDEQYNIDVVRSGTQLKLILHLKEFETENPGYFNVESVNPRDRMFTTLRSSTTGVTLSVAKQGQKNADGEGVFYSVFRGGVDYGIYAMWCTKKAPSPPKPKPTTPAPDEPSDPADPDAGTKTPEDPGPEAGGSTAPAGKLKTPVVIRSTEELSVPADGGH